MRRKRNFPSGGQASGFFPHSHVVSSSTRTVFEEIQSLGGDDRLDFLRRFVFLGNHTFAVTYRTNNLQ
jgi:hypothetical protein